MEPKKTGREEPANLIDTLNEKLYSRTAEIPEQERTILEPKKNTVPDEWEGDETLAYKKPAYVPKTSVYKKIFLGSIVFFVAALAVAGYSIFNKRNVISPDNVIVSLSGPVSVKGGDVTTIQIQIENKNTVPLTSVSLGAIFPDGTRYSTDPSKEFLRYRKDLNGIGAGEIKNETVSAVLFGADQTSKEISVEIKFGINGSSASYSQTKIFKVNLSMSPIVIRTDLVKEVAKGQEVTFGVDIEASSLSPLQNTLARIDYPAGFVFKSADPKPVSGNNIWSLGEMKSGDIRHIEIKGVIQGEDGQEKVFHVFGGVANTNNSANISTLFFNEIASLTISQPFLGATLSVNGSTDVNYVLTNHQPANVSVLWENTLPDKITDAEITVTLAGEVVDQGSVSSKDGGLYNGTTHTLTWNSRTTEKLALIPAKTESSVDFGFNLIPFVSGSVVPVKNPTIEVGLSVKGNRVSEQNVSEKIDSFVKRTIKVGTTIDFTSTGLYYNDILANSGPLPPKVGEETTYTIVWTVKNTVNNISGAKVTATIPSYARFIGTDSNLSYNPVSGQIVWNIGSIKAGVGYEEVPEQVAFQVGVTPVLSQVGSSPGIISAATFNGTDTFTGLPVTSKTTAVSTQLFSDAKVTREQQTVVQ